MKKSFLIILLILAGISSQSFAQKLEENDVDKFTNSSIKRTTWETLASTTSANSHFRISLIDTTEYFNLKIMRNEVFSIEEGQELMLKLDDGSIMKLKNLKYTITCTGCGAVGFNGSGAQGIQISFWLPKEQVAVLKTHKVVSYRMYMSDGYIEDDIKPKNAQKLLTCLNLL